MIWQLWTFGFSRCHQGRVKGMFNYENKIILKLFCRLTKFDVYKRSLHTCVHLNFFTVRHAASLLLGTNSYTAGSPWRVLLGKFYFQFRNLKVSNLLLPRNWVKTNNAIGYVSILLSGMEKSDLHNRQVYQTIKEKTKIFRPTGFSVMEVCPKFGYCVNQLLYDSDEFLIWLI